MLELLKAAAEITPPVMEEVGSGASQYDPSAVSLFHPRGLWLIPAGQPMNSFFIHTFGCQMNVHDSERMRGLLQARGLRPALSAAEADLIVVNTCSVREKAEQKLDSVLGTLRRLKTHRDDPPVIVVAGCVSSQRGESMLRRMPFIDIVLGPDNLAELPSLAFAAAGGAPPVVRTAFDLDSPTFLGAPSTDPGSSAFVSISKGCSERCAFCIVPATRGPERHRPASQVISEVSALVASGAAEVILLGQTVNGYQDPGTHNPIETGPGSGFADLLRQITAAVPALKRLRYTSPHPRHFGTSLHRAHADLPALCRHVHIPVQSGSDHILKRMIRRHTRDEYIAKIAELRSMCPDITVSTDLIVGFPGETDDDFELTLLLMREVRFFGVYGFKYSPRPGTPAMRLGDDVPDQTKGERLTRVFELSERLMSEHLQTLVGSEQDILLDEVSPRGEPRLSGRTVRNEIVHVPATPGLSLRSGLVRVRIIQAFKHSLEGELLSPVGHQCAPTHLPVLPH